MSGWMYVPLPSRSRSSSGIVAADRELVVHTLGALFIHVRSSFSRHPRGGAGLAPDPHSAQEQKIHAIHTIFYKAPLKYRRVSTPVLSSVRGLTVSEDRALLRVPILGLVPTADADNRYPASDAHPPQRSDYRHLRHQLLRGNIMYRTLHPMPVTLPDTPDERIRNTFRRKSFPSYITQFEDDHAGEPLW
ncbi:hypothetical protein C8R44DRAFT_981728 [Mycena epipterygia]|nr:hypothetical protein C8R44DRAFT_981728 [Mycena epipterygia]